MPTPRPSLPRPAHPRTAPTIPITPLLPLHAPPTVTPPPAPPSPARPRAFLPGYALSTHIVPAAFPRTTPHIPQPAPPPRGETETKDARAARVAGVAEELSALQARHPPIVDEGAALAQVRGRGVLWSAVNRYVRTGAGAGARGGGLTLFLAHANGMHKETWEPTLRHLLRDAEQGGRYQIDEVWAIDVVQQGDSGLLNAEALGALFIWTDHARDILNFVLNYLPEEIAPDDELPAHLPRVAPEVAEARAQRGFSSRKLVVVGHSVSGCCGVLALHSTPAPFAGLVLVDPVIHPVELDTAPGVRSYILGAVSRRDVWPSRAEAHALMRKSPFFGAWDPEVLQAYVDYALAEDADGQVRLKCTGIQEATIFADGLRSQEAWCALPHVDARIPIKWVMPPPPASVNKTEEIAQELVWRRAENASNVQIPTASHLTVQDSPKEVAEELDEFLARNFAVLKSSL